MFFLLPIIAGAAATDISAGEVALGVTAAVGVGAKNRLIQSRQMKS